MAGKKQRSGRRRKSVASRTLEFLILTAARPGEVISADADDFTQSIACGLDYVERSEMEQDARGATNMTKFRVTIERSAVQWVSFDVEAADEEAAEAMANECH